MKNLVILSGAGMSAESGISTFRDAGGLWDKYPVEQVATPEGYARNPEQVINFYNERRKQLLDVVPNAGHLGVADLERDFNVTVVTQNVDNLHERAGSKRVGKRRFIQKAAGKADIFPRLPDEILARRAREGEKLLVDVQQKPRGVPRAAVQIAAFGLA